MKLAIFSVLLLLGLASSAPTSKDDTLVVNEEFFPEVLKVYEGQHDIVKIYVPVNNLNFDDDSSSSESDDDKVDSTIFFVEADTKDGDKVDQGLYVKKGSKVTKLLDNGRDIAAPYDDTKRAFFATKDGIYAYNADKNEAEKYGSIDDDLIAIVMGNNTDTIYVLSACKHVYKVSEDGTKKITMDDVKNPEQIALDFAKNLFYADSSNKLFVVNADGTKQIEGLPENAKLTLLKPPFFLEDGIPVVAGKNTYTVYANGTVEEEDIKIDTEVTAYSMEATLVQYYAHEKKIYEYNILALLIGSVLEEVKEFLDDKKDDIQTVATRSRKNFIAKA